MSKHIPLLSDIDLSRTKFYPGDRILVRTSVRLIPEQYKKLVKTVKKFTGEDVRTLIVNCMDTKIVVFRFNEDPVQLVSRQHYQEQPIKPGVMNLRCAKVDLKTGDQLIVSVSHIGSELQRKRMYQWIQEWTGKDVEIRIMQEDLSC